MLKTYPIHQSPLYKIVGLGQLEERLHININKLDKLIGNNYRVWLNSNKREIQQPLGWLNQVHTHIGKLLSRIETPEYVHSKKRRSYISNANQHKGNVALAKTDISKFYPSTTRKMVWEMFVYKFKCAKHVADILADICCYQQKHIPTGSPISGRIAFFASLDLFNKVDDYCKKEKCNFTLYVDDLTISGKNATKFLISEVRKIIRLNGLKAKRSKTQTFPAYSAKTVTGVILKGAESRLPNKRHKAIADTRLLLQNAQNQYDKKQLKISLIGKLREAKQVTLH
jgi:hypothetical protein